MAVVKNFFETNLDDVNLSQTYTRLNLATDFDRFKITFFFALYFLFAAALNDFKEKQDNNVIYGKKALDLYVMSVYPTFGE